jgi:hypothetical protein
MKRPQTLAGVVLTASGFLILTYGMNPNMGSLSFVLFIVGLVAMSVGFILLIAGRKKKDSLPEPFEDSLDPRERIVTERVLVICPYCGTKNDQGIIKCRKCGAEM